MRLFRRADPEQLSKRRTPLSRVLPAGKLGRPKQLSPFKRARNPPQHLQQSPQ
nr:MAG TPA: hypothetical protein [Caudoviricetes sp.]